MRACSSAVVTGVALMVLCGCASEPLARITVDAGDSERIDTPVSVTLPRGASRHPLSLREIRGSDRVAVPAQVEPGPTPTLHWIVAGTLPAGQQRTYELVSGEARSDRLVKTVMGEKDLQLLVGDARVVQYNHAMVPPPKDLGRVPEERRALYNRNAFIHPLWSPAGNVLTDIQPPDHIHHLGIWAAWTETKYEGRKVDFWNVGDGTGTVRFSKYLSTVGGPVYGGFQAEHDYVALQTSKGEQTILKEVWDVRVYNVGGPEKGYWLVDFRSVQRCVAEQPLVQDEYRYGGLGFRATRQWKGNDAGYLTSEGKGRTDGNATRARWGDSFGKTGDLWEGVTFYSHPQNFRHPEPMRLWPEPDNYIFFNFCPSQLGPWEMKPGEDHVFRYRWLVHEGKPDIRQIERIWTDYANPPQVKIEPGNQRS